MAEYEDRSKTPTSNPDVIGSPGAELEDVVVIAAAENVVAEGGQSPRSGGKAKGAAPAGGGVQVPLVYLPKKIQGKTVLAKEGRVWRATNDDLKSERSGLGFRASKSLEENITKYKRYKPLLWGEAIEDGVDEGDGWVSFPEKERSWGEPAPSQGASKGTSMITNMGTADKDAALASLLQLNPWPISTAFKSIIAQICLALLALACFACIIPNAMNEEHCTGSRAILIILLVCDGALIGSAAVLAMIGQAARGVLFCAMAALITIPLGWFWLIALVQCMDSPLYTADDEDTYVACGSLLALTISLLDFAWMLLFAQPRWTTVAISQGFIQLLTGIVTILSNPIDIMPLHFTISGVALIAGCCSLCMSR